MPLFGESWSLMMHRIVMPNSRGVPSGNLLLSIDPNLSWKKKKSRFVHDGFFTNWVPSQTLCFVHDRVGIRHKTLGNQPGSLGLATPPPENYVTPWNSRDFVHDRVGIRHKMGG